MKRAVHRIACSLLLLLASAGPGMAGPDDYPGDSVIFGGATAAVKPNVLIILDTSGSMKDKIEVTSSGTSDPYDSSLIYSVTESCGEDWGEDPCNADRIYECKEWDNNYCNEWDDTGVNFEDSGPLIDPEACVGGPEALDTGEWSTSEYTLKSDGTCESDDGSNNVYATGNYVNWKRGGDSGDGTERMAKIEVAKQVIAEIVEGSSGVNLGLMKFYYNSNSSLIP